MAAVNVNILPMLWIPDLEIMDLMSFETHKILSKLEGAYNNFCKIDRSLERCGYYNPINLGAVKVCFVLPSDLDCDGGKLCRLPNVGCGGLRARVLTVWQQWRVVNTVMRDLTIFCRSLDRLKPGCDVCAGQQDHLHLPDGLQCLPCRHPGEGLI